MDKITPCLWFDNQAEEAIAHYLTIFQDGRIISASHYGEAGPGSKGMLMTALFELAGRRLMALNGGPHFKFTEAISLVVDCKSQAEVDHYWEKLSAGGSTGQCGWVKDKYGLSWQVVPSRLPELLQHRDPEVARRVMEAMLQMQKIDIAGLEAAAAEPDAPGRT